MDISQIEKKIKKITTVFDAFKEDGKISKIEKDLLLGYIRDLYEIVKEEALHTETPSSQIQKSTPEDPTIIGKAHEPITQEAPKIPESIIEQIKVVEVTPQYIQKTETKPDNVPVYSATQSVVESNSYSPSLKKLFSISAGKDVSDKFGLTSISDLQKAMSLNERLVATHDLFGNDNVLFNSTCSAINGLRSFEEAVETLLPIAEKYNWTSEDKEEKVQSFIRLVYRRFK